MRPHEFTPKMKLLAWDRCKGYCEICHARIISRAEYDHRIPLEIGGKSDFSNIQCLCPPCHRAKTKAQDMPDIAKAHRREKKAKGVTRSKQTIKTRNTFKKWKSNSVDVRDERT